MSESRRDLLANPPTDDFTIVYLAGAMFPDSKENSYRKEMIIALSDCSIVFICPLNTPLLDNDNDPRLYFLRDVLAVKKADVIVLNLEIPDKKYSGSSFEFGLAHGLGKETLLIDQLRKVKSFDLLRAAASIIVPDIPSAIEVLRFAQKSSISLFQ